MATPPPDVDHPDARTLRGLAHPLRLRILGALRSDGPSTATRLAAALGESSGATSYHLRQLAAYGFVVPDPQAARTGRERWWRATNRYTDLPRAEARSGHADAEGFVRALAADFHREAEAFVDGLHALPARWEDGWSMSDRHLRLTPQQAERLRAELAEVVARYPFDTPDRSSADDGDADDGAERVLVQVQILPQPRA